MGGFVLFPGGCFRIDLFAATLQNNLFCFGHQPFAQTLSLKVVRNNNPVDVIAGNRGGNKAVARVSDNHLTLTVSQPGCVSRCKGVG